MENPNIPWRKEGTLELLYVAGIVVKLGASRKCMNYVEGNEVRKWLSDRH